MTKRRRCVIVLKQLLYLGLLATCWRDVEGQENTTLTENPSSLNGSLNETSVSPRPQPETELPTTMHIEETKQPQPPTPSDSLNQTTIPSSIPTFFPSILPSNPPSKKASAVPSFFPSITQSSMPSAFPTISPRPTISAIPSIMPSLSRKPSSVPSGAPSLVPSLSPQPSDSPSKTPSSTPTVSSMPSISSRPSGLPSKSPSSIPTTKPSTSPSRQPSIYPSPAPSSYPTNTPSGSPSIQQRTISRSELIMTFTDLQEDFEDVKYELWENITNEHIEYYWNNYSSLRHVQVIDVSTRLRSQTRLNSDGSECIYNSTSPSDVPSIMPTVSVLPSYSPSSDPSSTPSSMPMVSVPPSYSPSTAPSPTPSILSGDSSMPMVSLPPSYSLSSAPWSSIPPSHSSTFLSSLRSITLLPSSFFPTTSPLAALQLSTTSTDSIISSNSTNATNSFASFTATNATNATNVTNATNATNTNASSFFGLDPFFLLPSDYPSSYPSWSPSLGPSNFPTMGPSDTPSTLPSPGPSSSPSLVPSESPSLTPTANNFVALHSCPLLVIMYEQNITYELRLDEDESIEDFEGIERDLFVDPFVKDQQVYIEKIANMTDSEQPISLHYVLLFSPVQILSSIWPSESPSSSPSESSSDQQTPQVPNNAQATEPQPITSYFYIIIPLFIVIILLLVIIVGTVFYFRRTDRRFYSPRRLSDEGIEEVYFTQDTSEDGQNPSSYVSSLIRAASPTSGNSREPTLSSERNPHIFPTQVNDMRRQPEQVVMSTPSPLLPSPSPSKNQRTPISNEIVNTPIQTPRHNMQQPRTGRHLRSYTDEAQRYPIEEGRVYGESRSETNVPTPIRRRLSSSRSMDHIPFSFASPTDIEIRPARLGSMSTAHLSEAEDPHASDESESSQDLSDEENMDAFGLEISILEN